MEANEVASRLKSLTYEEKARLVLETRNCTNAPLFLELSIIDPIEIVEILCNTSAEDNDDDKDDDDDEDDASLAWLVVEEAERREVQHQLEAFKMEMHNLRRHHTLARQQLDVTHVIHLQQLAAARYQHHTHTITNMLRQNVVVKKI